MLRTCSSKFVLCLCVSLALPRPAALRRQTSTLRDPTGFFQLRSSLCVATVPTPPVTRSTPRKPLKPYTSNAKRNKEAEAARRNATAKCLPKPQRRRCQPPPPRQAPPPRLSPTVVARRSDVVLAPRERPPPLGHRVLWMLIARNPLADPELVKSRFVEHESQWAQHSYPAFAACKCDVPTGCAAARTRVCNSALATPSTRHAIAMSTPAAHREPTKPILVQKNPTLDIGFPNIYSRTSHG